MGRLVDGVLYGCLVLSVVALVALAVARVGTKPSIESVVDDALSEIIN